RSGQQPGARHRRGPAADGQPDREPAAPVAADGQGGQPVQEGQYLVPRRVLTNPPRNGIGNSGFGIRNGDGKSEKKRAEGKAEGGKAIAVRRELHNYAGDEWSGGAGPELFRIP